MTVKNLLAVSMVLVLCSCAQEDAAAPAENAATESSVTAAPVVADPAEVAARVAAADAAMGKRQYIYCQSCHTGNAGGQNKFGPNLSGVIDRAAGQAEGFVYADALSNTGLVWNLATLDAWIENPRKLAPGTTMIFGGVKDPAQRKLHKAFLRYHDSSNWPLLSEALKRMGRADLIGDADKQLIPKNQPKSGGDYHAPRRKNSESAHTRRTGGKKMLTQHTGLPPRDTGASNKPSSVKKKSRGKIRST